MYLAVDSRVLKYIGFTWRSVGGPCRECVLGVLVFHFQILLLLFHHLDSAKDGLHDLRVISGCFSLPMVLRTRPKTRPTHSFLSSGFLRTISGPSSPMFSRKHANWNADNVERDQYVENWLQQSINWTRSEVCLSTSHHEQVH